MSWGTQIHPWTWPIAEKSKADNTRTKQLGDDRLEDVLASFSQPGQHYPIYVGSEPNEVRPRHGIRSGGEQYLEDEDGCSR